MGTNSMDKQKGSFALVRQLMELKTNGIIATHDLLLGKLIEYFPKEIRNYCFEADITNDELTFSYKLREGIAHKFSSKKGRRRIVAYVESYDDIAFWRTLLAEFENEDRQPDAAG